MHQDATTYRLWVLDQSDHLPKIYADTILSLPNFPPKYRKHLMSLCRVQSRPTVGSPLWKQIGTDGMADFDVIDRTIWEGKRGYPITLLEIITQLEENSTPFLYSFLSLCVRSAPYIDYGPVEEVIATGVQKELEAAVNIYHPVKLNFGSIFSGDTDQFSTPLYEDLPGDPRVAFSLFRNFCLARNRLRDTTIWPDVSNKTVGEQVALQFWEAYWRNQQDWKQEQDVTTGDLERLYAETGEKILGPVEARSSWKYNELKPRIYYARGGQTYHSSKYIQHIFNIILDCFDEVHRVDRYLEPSIGIDPEETAVVYDYESFTSSLEEIKNFVVQMAVFFGDTWVTVIDSNQGPIRMSVGEILLEYNAKCNVYGEFDASLLFHDPDFRSLFHTCGMLGVPGNISSCTLLHGILIRFIVGMGKGRSVGDDGKVYTCLGAEHKIGLARLFKHLKTIGRLQPTKVFDFKWFDLDFEQKELFAYQFLKRPYIRLDVRMLTGSLYVLPNPFILFGFSDGYHVNPIPSLDDRLRVFGKGWNRFLLKFSQNSEDVLSQDQDRLNRFYRSTRTRFKILHKEKFTKNVLSSYRRYLGAPEVELVAFNMGDYILSRYDLDDDIYLNEEYIEGSRGLGLAGEEWVLPSSSLLSWLETLKYVTVQDCKIAVTRRAYGDEYIKTVIRGRYRLKKIVAIRSPLPSWIRLTDFT